MTNLRRFSPDAVQLVADSVRRDLAGRVLTEVAVRSALKRLMFLDARGDTWTLGPVTRQWFVQRKGSWRRAEAPGGDFDGPAEWAAVLKGSPPPAEPQESAQADPGDDPAAFLKDSVERVWAAYARGGIHSEAAEAMLAQLFAVDRHGSVWAYGIRSHKWHTFAAQGWQQSPHGPTRSDFLSPEPGAPPKHCTNCGEPITAGAKFCANCGTPVVAGPQAADSAMLEQGLERFLAAAAELFPESIVPAWDPPEEFPEQVLRCPHCEALNVGEVADCVSCGTPMDGVPASAPVKQPMPAQPLSASPPAPSSAAAPPPAAPASVPPSQAVPAAPPPAAVSPSPAPAPSSHRRWWLLGGGACLLAACACVAGSLVLIALLSANN